MTALREHAHEDIKGLLVGRTVEKVSEDTLRLDNGLELRIDPNWGCGGCSNGNYRLDALNGVENAITDVAFEIGERGHDDVYRIFVYTAGIEVGNKLLEVSGHDNGWYGSGYTIYVTAPE